MNAVRTWLGSGSVVAGVGAAMLCGAGLAAADTGATPGSDKTAAHAAASASPAPQRGTRRSQTAAPRVMNTRVDTSNTAAVPAAAVVASARPAPASRSESPSPTVRRAAAVPVPTASAVAPPAGATEAMAPSNVPVDPAQFAGTYYEQGSVKQFFSIGLVNTKAVYTLKTDGTIRVQNSGNYFFNRGPKSSIVGSAVPVNSINTALNVSFLPFNSAKPPGNYTILANATDCSWVIVSDPSGRTGYILTRSKIIPA